MTPDYFGRIYFLITPMTKLFTSNRAIIALLASALVSISARYFDIEITETFAIEFIEFALQIGAGMYAVICIYLTRSQW